MKTCEDCGKVSECGKDINCPYDEEILDKITPVTICYDCYIGRCQEI